MAIKGKAEIVLTDVHTGEVEVIREENMVTNVIQEIFSHNIEGMLFCVQGQGTTSFTDYILPLCKNAIGGIILFQDALTEGKIDSDFKLKVVKTVKQNDTINGGYVHRNNCYVDYQDYLKATRAAATLANDAARAEAFADATTKLRESGVASGKKKEENIITMPIFMITSK